MEEQSLFDGEGTPIENEHYRWVYNKYPKFDGHTMLVPKRHFAEFDEETDEEIVARHKLLIVASDALRKAFPGAGIEVFLQIGAKSARSIRHIHWHVVPADPSDPLRSFEKLGHFYTTKPDEEKVVLFPVPVKLACEGLQKVIAEAL